MEEFIIPTLSNFLRSTPADLIQGYFAASGVPDPEDVPWTSPASLRGARLQKFVECLDPGQKDRVTGDSERIGSMADEAGQAALFAVTAHEEILDGLPNIYAQMTWVYVNDRLEFESAEQVRFADEHRHGRMWEGVHCEAGHAVARDQENVEAFKQTLRSMFQTDHVEVEICDRSRLRTDGSARLVQTAVYREGRVGERKAFVDGKLDRLPNRPVLEAAITYEPASGVIEIVAPAKDSRKSLVQAFADHLLGAPFSGERLRIRQYVLARLRRPYLFPTDPEDDIETVRLTMVRLMPHDAGGERITLECLRGVTRTIWEMAEARLGDRNPMLDGHTITKARFTVKFRSVAGRGGGRTLPITISVPKGCDLKDRTSRERLIGEKYLRSWGLVRDI